LQVGCIGKFRLPDRAPLRQTRVLGQLGSFDLRAEERSCEIGIKAVFAGIASDCFDDFVFAREIFNSGAGIPFAARNLVGEREALLDQCQ